MHGIPTSTQDIAKTEMREISFVVRFVELTNSNNDQTSNNIVKQLFLRFVEAEDQSSEALEKTLLNYFNENMLDIRKLRGQGYDGATNMSGVYNGLREKIFEKQPKAAYVHCAAHTLI